MSTPETQSRQFVSSAWLARALAEQYALGWIDREVPQVSREKAKEHYDYVMLGNGRYMIHFRKLAKELLRANDPDQRPGAKTQTHEQNN